MSGVGSGGGGAATWYESAHVTPSPAITEAMATSPVFMAMTGWLCVQHRGGPKAFVRVLDEHTLGSADHRGNTQFIALTG